jgi:spoIIIJ-associated protein
MEWVETTAKTIDAAREAALDQLGVAADEAEFDVIEEPRPGLFGRVRGEARIRARVRPATVRPKQERRRKGRSDGETASSVTESSSKSSSRPSTKASSKSSTKASAKASTDTKSEPAPAETADDAAVTNASSDNSTPQRARRRTTTNKRNEEPTMTNDERPESTVTPDEVGTAAVAFMEGLTGALGADAAVAVNVDGIELDVTVTGSDLGLLVGPGGRTLNAVQDLTRVAAQRRLGDHETRLRVDVAGYRERREAALGSFARDVADQVLTSETPRSLEPMTSADRKVVHDVLNEIDGVTTRSVGEDPDRRIIVDPA